MTYRSSPTLRICSASSSEGTPNIGSSCAMREASVWIFSLTATVSYTRARQECIPHEGPWTYFVTLVDGGDDTQGGFERAECI